MLQEGETVILCGTQTEQKPALEAILAALSYTSSRLDEQAGDVTYRYSDKMKQGALWISRPATPMQGGMDT